MIITAMLALAAAQVQPAQGRPGPRPDHGARMQRMFDMADADHDGRLTRAEFNAAHERMRERRMMRMQRQGGAGWGGPPRGPRRQGN